MAKKRKNSNYHQRSSVPDMPSEVKGTKRVSTMSKVMLIVAAVSLISAYIVMSQSTVMNDAWGIASCFLMALGCGCMSVVQRENVAEKNTKLSKVFLFVLVLVCAAYLVGGMMLLLGVGA